MPLSSPVARTFTETPSGAVEKHMAEIRSFMVTDPTSVALMVCNRKTMWSHTVAMSPSVSLIVTIFSYEFRVYVVKIENINLQNK